MIVKIQTPRIKCALTLENGTAVRGQNLPAATKRDLRNQLLSLVLKEW